MYHIGLQTLRAKIRGFHVAGSTIASRISKAEREKKNRLWDLKRELGVHARHHLIAYGLLRGIPYEKIERCASNNRPNPHVVLGIVQAHNAWVPGKVHQKYDLPAVERLLVAQPTALTLAQEKAA